MTFPAEAFRPPRLDRPTPVTVRADGRLFGHICAWTDLHRGHDDRMQRPPKGAPLDLFHRYTIDTTGRPIAVGLLSLGAPGQYDHDVHGLAGLDALAAAAAFDSHPPAAYVVAREDAHGLAVAGMLAPGLTAMQRRRVRTCSWSGDWRSAGRGGWVALVGIVAVDDPGFAVGADDARMFIHHGGAK